VALKVGLEALERPSTLKEPIKGIPSELLSIPRGIDVREHLKDLLIIRERVRCVRSSSSGDLEVGCSCNST
jgi:hypothetical protein